VVIHQLQVERRTAKAHRPKTNALQLDQSNHRQQVEPLQTRFEPTYSIMTGFQNLYCNLYCNGCCSFTGAGRLLVDW